MKDNSKLHKISYIWLRNKKINKILFFTYKFNFKWFHDYILPSLAKSLKDNGNIIIIASRADEVERGGFGNFYQIDNWFKIQNRFKVYYLDKFPLHHEKLIFVDYEGKENCLFGWGSSNLTEGGWSRNFEAWHWLENNNAGIASTIIENLINYKLPGEFLLPWRGVFKKNTAKNNSLFHLIGDSKRKSDQFNKMWNQVAKNVNDPKLIRISSPYFDDKSDILLTKILDILQIKHIDIEFIIDSSFRLSAKRDLEKIKKLKDLFKNNKSVNITIKNLIQIHSDSKIENKNVPLHAKFIEIISSDGSGIRIFGSANFTFNAWLGSNTEIVFIEKFSVNKDFSNLLLDEYEIKSISNSEVNKLLKFETSSLELEEDKVLHKIFWATYNETRSLLRVQFSSPSKVKSISLVHGYDPQRDLDGQEDAISILNNIGEKFINMKKWGKPKFEKDFIIWERLSTFHEEVPERLKVILKFDDDQSIEWPVFLEEPKFEFRVDSGVPKSTSDVFEDIFGNSRPIVPPIKNKIIFSDSTDGVEDDEEDETVTVDDFDLPALSDEAEYNHLPKAMKMVKAYNSITKDDDRVFVKESLKMVMNKENNPKDQFIAKAFWRALREK